MQEEEAQDEPVAHEHGCVCCSEGPAAYEARVSALIEEHGFAILAIGDAEPPYAYTIGLSARGLPELILVGYFGMELFNSLVGNIAMELLERAPDIEIPAADLTEVICETARITEESHDITIQIHSDDGPVDVPVGLRRIQPQYHDMLLGRAIQKYGEGIACVQIFIPDASGKLPWESGFWVPWGMSVQQVPLYVACDEEALAQPSNQ